MGKVLYGIQNVYVAKITEDAQGNVSYGTPFALKGATGFSPEPQGDTVKFYADNIVYFRREANNGYEGELTLAVTPDDFMKQIMGRQEDSNGAIVENANDKQARFALMFEAQGDPKYRRYVYWDCTATRPSREHSTIEDSIEVGTESMTITIAPRSTDMAIGCYMEKTDDNVSAYNAWFTSVYESDVSL